MRLPREDNDNETAPDACCCFYFELYITTVVVASHAYGVLYVSINGIRKRGVDALACLALMDNKHTAYSLTTRCETMMARGQTGRSQQQQG